jgi:hypothetical protein
VKYRTKRWNALIEFRDYLLRTKEEKIRTFNGHTLVTDKGTYGLFDGTLQFKEALIKKKSKKNVI